MPADKAFMASELEKLALLVHSNKKTSLTSDDLKAISFNEIESQVWDLTDAISKKDKKNALRLVNKLFKEMKIFLLSFQH